MFCPGTWVDYPGRSRCRTTPKCLKHIFPSIFVYFSDSFILDFESALYEYSSRTTSPTRAVFRFVDQSDEIIQQQMLEYMKEMSELDSVREAPKFFWLWHFNEFLNQTGLGDEVPFNEKLATFLDIQIFHDLYGKEIRLDDEGNIVSSRGYYFMDDVGLPVRDQIDALSEQSDAMARQPINQGKSSSDFPFISYNGIFNVWEFYSRCGTFHRRLDDLIRVRT